MSPFRWETWERSVEFYTRVIGMTVVSFEEVPEEESMSRSSGSGMSSWRSAAGRAWKTGGLRMRACRISLTLRSGWIILQRA